MVAKTDEFICLFGENYLKKHKRKQMAIVCFNEMRELARLLIALREATVIENHSLADAIDPVMFDTVDNNPYLFAYPDTIRWTRGDVAIRRFTKKADLEYPNEITANKSRKQIAAVMQILNLNKEESEQFAQSMAHTEKTHNEFYK
ncbi:unnamed protein product [Phaedon cochleariae]|uniref:Uncharacterized protein n=1 Tax=Phaedon cochleariae TaxID=80249 RepID=A0A9N9SKM8_PHACE|nr:unnamed protein product [Phaedon cochleariae]